MEQIRKLNRKRIKVIIRDVLLVLLSLFVMYIFSLINSELAIKCGLLPYIDETVRQLCHYGYTVTPMWCRQYTAYFILMTYPVTYPVVSQLVYLIADLGAMSLYATIVALMTYPEVYAVIFFTSRRKRVLFNIIMFILVFLSSIVAVGAVIDLDYNIPAISDIEYEKMIESGG